MENFAAHWVAIATPALLLGVVVAVWVVRFLRRRRNQVSLRHLRGRSLRTAQQVQEALADTSPNQGIRLGQYLLPQRVAYGHFAIVGATGSGKTLLQRLLMQSVLPRIGKGLDQRALIYDAKQSDKNLLPARPPVLSAARVSPVPATFYRKMPPESLNPGESNCVTAR